MKMKWIYDFCLYLAGMVIAAVPIVVRAIPGTERLYDSELEAVRAATNLYNPISIRDDREFMGTIYKSGQYYGFTVSAGEIGANRIAIEIPVQQWDSVVALWHTHGNASPLKQFFSRLDTRLVEQFGKPLYLADYTGSLKVFRPGDRPLSGFAAQRYGLPEKRGYALGEVVHDEEAQQISVQTRHPASIGAVC